MAENKEKYREVLNEEYECICENCSKPFKGIDEDATLCPVCWEALLDEIAEANGLEVDK